MADGRTTHGTGTADGNLAGLPLGGALNQCGGADLPLEQQLSQMGIKVITSKTPAEEFGKLKVCDIAPCTSTLPL
jgi:hypothetical protein